MPKELLKRADEILAFYEADSKQKRKEELDDNIQLTMAFDEEEKKDPLKEKLEKIDPLRLTPLEALNILYELKEFENEK